jgi:hypothetical protein
MTSPRAAAVAELFTALDGLMISYQLVPDDERESCWTADAERITGEISRLLATARARLSPGFDAIAGR